MESNILYFDIIKFDALYKMNPSGIVSNISKLNTFIIISL
jgi:hypothetical protein